MNPAMNQTTHLVPLTDQGLIRASGADAASFLHNLLTNDIEHIPAGGARNAGLCTAKGRLIASFLIWREGDGFSPAAVGRHPAGHPQKALDVCAAQQGEAHRPRR